MESPPSFFSPFPPPPPTIAPTPPPSGTGGMNNTVAVSVMVGLGVFLLLASIKLYAVCMGSEEDSVAAARAVAAAARRADPSSGQAKKKGLSPEAIAAFPTRHYSVSDDGEAECPVCLGDFQQGEVVKELPLCGHAFHLDCIDHWLTVRMTCPLCRLCYEQRAEVADDSAAAQVAERGEEGRPAAEAEEEGSTGEAEALSARGGSRREEASAVGLPETERDGRDGAPLRSGQVAAAPAAPPAPETTIAMWFRRMGSLRSFRRQRSSRRVSLEVAGSEVEVNSRVSDLEAGTGVGGRSPSRQSSIHIAPEAVQRLQELPEHVNDDEVLAIFRAARVNGVGDAESAHGRPTRSASEGSSLAAMFMRGAAAAWGSGKVGDSEDFQAGSPSSLAHFPSTRASPPSLRGTMLRAEAGSGEGEVGLGPRVSSLGRGEWETIGISNSRPARGREKDDMV